MKNDNYKILSDLVIESMSDNKKDNEELRHILSENSCSEDLVKNVSSKECFTDAVYMLNEAFENREEQALLLKIKQQDLRRKRIRKYVIGACSSAAAAIFALSFYLLNTDKEKLITTTTSVVAAKITKPTLIIDNSDYIELKGENKQIIAENYSKEISTENEKISNQRLVVPYGNTYSVILEDGTEVLLNSNSELLYPSKFTSDERRVELRGEAFFKVKKDVKPFIVSANSSYIRVYGTSFNINAKNQTIVKTILVEGSVGVGLDELSMTLIRPNQMATIDVKNKIQNISDINADNYLAWKDGFFKFIDTDFSDMIDELENWYGKNFNYNEELFKDVKVNFSILRTSTIEKSLEFIQSILKIKVTEKGGEYIIERAV